MGENVGQVSRLNATTCRAAKAVNPRGESERRIFLNHTPGLLYYVVMDKLAKDAKEM